MNIVTRVIPHDQQRYPTTGDWFFDDEGTLVVHVSDMGDWRYENLVAIHEAVEALLCAHAGIDEDRVSAFDILYEAVRDSYQGARDDPAVRATLMTAFGCGCEITGSSEPGDDIHAPYYRQHQLATGIERVLAVGLGVAWNDYEAANLNLYDA